MNLKDQIKNCLLRYPYLTIRGKLNPNDEKKLISIEQEKIRELEQRARKILGEKFYDKKFEAETLERYIKRGIPIEEAKKKAKEISEPIKLKAVKDFFSGRNHNSFRIAANSLESWLDKCQQWKDAKQIEKMLPDAERGMKVLQGAKKRGKSKNEVYRAVNLLYQREAKKIWMEKPTLYKTQMADELIERINHLNKNPENVDWDKKDGLSELALFVSDNELPTNPNTLRRILRKPSDRTRK